MREKSGHPHEISAEPEAATDNLTIDSRQKQLADRRADYTHTHDTGTHTPGAHRITPSRTYRRVCHAERRGSALYSGSIKALLRRY